MEKSLLDVIDGVWPAGWPSRSDWVRQAVIEKLQRDHPDLLPQVGEDDEAPR